MTATTLYSFTVRRPDGTPWDLWDLHGGVVVAAVLPAGADESPHLTGLTRLAQTFAGPGLTVLGLPHGAAPSVAVDFPVTAAITGDAALLQWLTGGAGEPPAFTKFLIGRDGVLVGSYAPNAEAKPLIAAVQQALAAPVPPPPPRPEPTVDPVSEPTGEPVSEPTAEPTAEPVSESTAEGPPEPSVALVEAPKRLDMEILEAEILADDSSASLGADLQSLGDDFRQIEAEQRAIDESRGSQPPG